MRRPYAFGNATRPLFSSFVLFALVLLSGCSGKSDVVTTHSTPDIVAVTAPDSVAPGQKLEVKIHWLSTGTCQSFEGVSFQQIDDSTYFAQCIMKEVQDPKTPCTARDTILEGNFVVADPPARTIRIIVYGAHQQDTVAVLGGAAPAAIERHELHIVDAVTGGPVAGGSGNFVDLSNQAPFAALVTDSFGLADTAFACGGASRSYKVTVVGASGRRATLLFVDHPEHCGVAEKTWVRL